MLTNEQIEQNALEYRNRTKECGESIVEGYARQIAHEAGAHSRDAEVKALEEEIEKLRHPWVSVEERTPNFVEENAYNKLSGNNIVRVRNNQTGETRVDTALYIQSKETKRCVWAIHELWYDEEVTHWMEIPE